MILSKTNKYEKVPIVKNPICTRAIEGRCNEIELPECCVNITLKIISNQNNIKMKNVRSYPR